MKEKQQSPAEIAMEDHILKSSNDPVIFLSLDRLCMPSGDPYGKARFRMGSEKTVAFLQEIKKSSDELSEKTHPLRRNVSARLRSFIENEASANNQGG